MTFRRSMDLMFAPDTALAGGGVIHDANDGHFVDVDPASPRLTPDQLAAAQESAVSASRAEDEAAQQQLVISEGEPEPTPTGRVFTEEEVNKIRTEEKDKLYGRIKSMDEQLQELRAEREKREQEEAAAIAEAEAAQKAAEEEKLSVNERMNLLRQESADAVKALEEKLAIQQQVFEKEKQLEALETFKQSVLAQNVDTIMPELFDMIQGNTQEEILASAEAAADKTAAIMANVRASAQAQLQGQRGVAPTGVAPVGPMEQASGSRTITATDIGNMSMGEYAKHRESLLQAASASRR